MRDRCFYVILITLACASPAVAARGQMGHPETTRNDSVSDSTRAASAVAPAKSITLILHLPPLQTSAAIVEAFTDAGYPVEQANTVLVKSEPKRHMTLVDVAYRRVQAVIIADGDSCAVVLTGSYGSASSVT